MIVSERTMRNFTNNLFGGQKPFKTVQTGSRILKKWDKILINQDGGRNNLKSAKRKKSKANNFCIDKKVVV